MGALSRSRSRTAVAAAFAALAWLACSSQDAEDGEACESSADCKSAKCKNGACQGADCACEGPDCRGRSTCREGWLCTLGGAVTATAIPECRQQCSGVGSCSPDKHCENGVCRDGGEPFGLSWTNIPRPVPCGARVPCVYKVDPSAGVDVETYTWSFGESEPLETKEPTAEYTYPVAGTFSVLVRAKSTSGVISELRTNETLCVGGIEDSCDVLATLCCEGTCVRGLCK